MAFQQPTRQLPQRTNRPAADDGASTLLAPRESPTPNESQTWVLFTPGTDAGTVHSYLSSAQDDQTTPGRSMISDLGSLGSAARSDLRAPSEAVLAESDAVVEEDAELDSLDSHLPDFRAVPNPYNQPSVPHAVPVLPAHDGLGSFKFEAPGMSAEAQDRLYAFERFNPNRVRHRAESFSLAQLEFESDEAQELERNRRIEAWRLEQSQLLLDDIRKETRRRRQSEASIRRAQQQATSPQEAAERIAADQEAADVNLGGTDWHEQDTPSSGDPTTKPGLLSRIARKVICDLMGLDDKLLAILFGEALPDEEMLSSLASVSAADVPSALPASESSYDSDWQLRMLERVARELGVLVHHMSAHPGAFSAYARVQQMPIPYAGLPVIPEAPADVGEEERRGDDGIPSVLQFKPTLSRPAEMPGPWSSGPPSPSAPSAPDAAPAAPSPHTFTQQEWEQDLDIRLVFRYLRSRFTSARPSSPPFSSGTSHLATSSTQDAAAKAARVRQHHPLLSHAHQHGYHHRPRPAERRAFFKATVPPSPAALRHPPGSCASQSTRRSARRSSISSRASSRHYWDIGGSIGTGSVIASTGPMGSWGEV